MKNTIKYALFGAVMALVMPVHADAAGCNGVSSAVKAAIGDFPNKVLEIVADAVAKNKSCAGDVVQAAIRASHADRALVGNIVDAAVTAAPSQAKVITQSALAIAPDAYPEVQARLEQKGRLVENGGGGKGVVSVSASPNPLDFPNGGQDVNPVGPINGGVAAGGLIPPTPPVITPPASTEENK